MASYIGAKTLMLPTAEMWDLATKEEKQKLIDILEELLRRLRQVEKGITNIIDEPPTDDGIGGRVRRGVVFSAPTGTDLTVKVTLLGPGGAAIGFPFDAYLMFVDGATQAGDCIPEIAAASIVPIFKDVDDNWYCLTTLTKVAKCA